MPPKQKMTIDWDEVSVNDFVLVIRRDGEKIVHLSMSRDELDDLDDALREIQAADNGEPLLFDQDAEDRVDVTDYGRGGTFENLLRNEAGISRLFDALGTELPSEASAASQESGAELLDEFLGFWDRSDEHPVEDAPKGRTIKLMYDPVGDEPDRMRHRLVVPISVQDFYDIVGSRDLDADDVVEFHVPIGG